MDKDKLTRWHYAAAGVGLPVGAIAVGIEWINNGLQRPVRWLPLVGVMVALVYLLTLNPAAKRLRLPRTLWLERALWGLEAVFMLELLYNFIDSSMWDGLQLLVVLGLGGILLHLTIQRHKQEKADQQAEAERKIVEARLQGQRLQDYLDWMSELLIETDLGQKVIPDGLKLVARERTLTTLGTLDGEHKGQLLKFLYEANLISEERVEVDLASADFHQAQLERVNLERACLAEVNLEGANLTEANLTGANLERARLAGANLERARLAGANVERAHLVGTHLAMAGLRGANLARTNMVGANLAWANLTEAYLVEANLSWATLSWAHLTGAHLEQANLANANLAGTHLEQAYLAGANLTSAPLERAILDEKTILPDGSYYQP